MTLRLAKARPRGKPADPRNGSRETAFQPAEFHSRPSQVRWPIALSLLLAVGLLAPLTGCGTSVASDAKSESEGTAARTTNEDAAGAATEPSRVLAARETAAEADKYLFALFTKGEDENTEEMRSVFKKAMAKAADRANTVTVQVTDPAEKKVVEEYGLEHAPMPLVLAIAPNGAVTGGFPTRFSEEELLSAFASPASERCMKSLQDGKLVFLCVQNEQTEMKDEAMEGVKDFAADELVRDMTEIVRVDPADDAEQSFLEELRIDPTTETALSVLLAPPGTLVAIHEGATSKDQWFAELQRGGSCCGPGGPGGPGGPRGPAPR